MKTINLNLKLTQELFNLISLLSTEFNKEFFNFKLTGNSLTFETFTPLDEDQAAELDDTIANWMDHAEDPELLDNFDWKISQEDNSFTFNW